MYEKPQQTLRCLQSWRQLCAGATPWTMATHFGETKSQPSRGWPKSDWSQWKFSVWIRGLWMGPKEDKQCMRQAGGKLIFIVLVYFILRDIYSWDTIRSDTTSPYFFTSNNICCSFLVRSAVEEHCWLLGIYPFHRTYLSSTSRLNNADSNLNQPWGKEASK